MATVGRRSFPVFSRWSSSFLLSCLFSGLLRLLQQRMAAAMPGKVSKPLLCIMISDQSSGSKRLLTSDQTSNEEHFKQSSTRILDDSNSYYLLLSVTVVYEVNFDIYLLFRAAYNPYLEDFALFTPNGLDFCDAGKNRASQKSRPLDVVVFCL